MTEAINLDPPTSRRRATISTKIEMAGLQLFVERGMEAVTVEDIANAAGISRRTFYRYFDAADSVLTAFPMRSLRRLSRDVQSRPPTESLREAFLNATARIDPPEGREMLPLLAKIARKSPAAFDRAIARMKPITHEFFVGMVEARLRLMGEDEKRAGLVAAVLIAAIEETASDYDASGRSPINRAFDDLARILGR